ncbi:extracellular solute-binding protein [Paenibacillus sp.]|uniref:extracellular solute-binding protein n=1 Tax=Paenibacillus sp. TaxID=58172 RepID=UPI0028112A18|nr:extracellular solute-binding protein [Paenibacillus sp.]
MSGQSDRLSFQEKLDYMVSTLRSEIINGTRKPGSYLPAESALAKQFHLSNKSVRKGLDELVAEGLIVKIDRVGSMVSKDRQVVTVNFGCNPSLTDDIQMTELLEEFHRRHPGIRVRAIPLDFFEHVSSAGEMLSSGLLDVVSFSNSQFQELVENDERLSLLEPLEPDEGIYPIASEAFRCDGRLYARAVSFSPVVLCYNKGHFREAGLPEPDSYWTWDDLVDTAQKLTAHSGRHSVYFVPASLNRYSLFLLQSGMETSRDEAGRVRIGPKLAYSLRKFSDIVNDHDIFPKYFSGTNEDDSVSLFMQEKVSMILTTYFSLNAFKSLPLEYDISPVPLLRRGGEQKTLLLSIGVGVNRRAKEKEAALAFADFLASPEAQLVVRERTTSIPARKLVAEQGTTDQLNRPGRYLMYRELFPSFMYHKDLGLSIPSLKSISNRLKEYWSGISDERDLHMRLEELIIESNP